MNQQITQFSSSTEKTEYIQNSLQSQVFSLILVVLILVTFAFVVHSKVKSMKVDEAPKGVVLLAETYVMSIHGMYKGSAGNVQRPEPYIFTLITFLLLGNILGIIGLDPVSSSYSVTLVLALVSWIGIYVVGITYNKWRYFKKYVNPLEYLGQFAPLISLSFRMFGNIVGGSVIMYLIYWASGSLWGLIPFIGEVNLLGSLIAPAFHLYFDLFGGLVQAYVFTLLTLIYWALEAGDVKEVEETKESLTEKRQELV